MWSRFNCTLGEYQVSRYGLHASDRHYIILHLSLLSPLDIWGANRTNKAVYTYFSTTAAPLGGYRGALLPAGTSSNRLLQHVLGLPRTVLSVIHDRFTFKAMHMRGWCPIQVSNTLSWLLLNAKEWGLNSLWTAWLVSVSWTACSASVCKKLTLAAWIPNRFPLVPAESSWP